MSLGGFAAGLAGAFQKAEDRYQERKLRQQASAEAKLRQAAGFAFQEKMYNRRARDAFQDELTKTRNYLGTVFGNDAEGREYISALLPFGEAAIEIVKSHQQQALDRGVDLKSFIQIAHPNGIDKNTYKAPDLDNVMSYLSKKKFGENLDDFKFKLPTAKFLPFKQEYDYDVAGTTFEATINGARQKLISAERNIKEGNRVEFHKNVVEDMKKMIKNNLVAMEKEAAKNKGTGTGTDEYTASLTSTFTKEIANNLGNVLDDNVFIMNTEDRFTIMFDGNAQKSLTAISNLFLDLPDSVKNYQPKPGVAKELQTFTTLREYTNSAFKNAINPYNTYIKQKLNAASMMPFEEFEKDGQTIVGIPTKEVVLRDGTKMEFPVKDDAAIDLTGYDVFKTGNGIPLTREMAIKINSVIGESITGGDENNIDQNSAVRVITYINPTTNKKENMVSSGFRTTEVSDINPLGLVLFPLITRDQLNKHVGLE